MENLSIKEFCELHGACTDGKEWAIANNKTMDEVWNTSKPEWLVWIATRPNVLTEKELILFSCFCVRRVWHLLDDEGSKNAVVVAEKYANGEATKDELSAAAYAAANAANAAAHAANAAAHAADAADEMKLKIINYGVSLLSRGKRDNKK